VSFIIFIFADLCGIFGNINIYNIIYCITIIQSCFSLASWLYHYLGNLSVDTEKLSPLTEVFCRRVALWFAAVRATEPLAYLTLRALHRILPHRRPMTCCREQPRSEWETQHIQHTTHFTQRQPDRIAITRTPEL